MSEEQMTKDEELVKNGQHKNQHKHYYYHHNHKHNKSSHEQANTIKNETSFENKEEKVEQTKEAKPEEKNVHESCVSVTEFVKLKYQLAEMINRYKQLEHEFDNYRIRTKQEAKQAKTDGLTKAIETILPALDSFKKAKALITDKGSLSGVNLIEKSLLVSLEKLNIKYIDCIGQEFNPEFHNAVMLVEDNTKQPNTVVDEIEMGFTLDGKVIKYSQVIVSK